jgi:prevent-host-death family protein
MKIVFVPEFCYNVVKFTTFYEGVMDTYISAADANRKFSQLLRGASKGENYIVTTHGKPVVKISAVDVEADKKKRERAFKKLMMHLKAQPAMNLGKITRDELYD